VSVKIESSGTLAGVFSKMDAALQASTVTTINRITRNANTVAVRLIAKDAGVKQQSIRGSKKKNLKSLISVRKATKNSPIGSVQSTGKRMGLGRMSAKWDKRKAGASFINKRGVRTVVPGAFIINRAGGKLVLKRIKGAAKVKPQKGRYKDTNIKRQPLVKLKGPSIAKVFSRKYIQKEITLLVKNNWSIELNRAIGVHLRRKF